MYPIFIFRLVVKFIIAVICLVCGWIIINQEINIALIVTYIIFIFPFAWGTVWVKTFKVVVDECTITVRKYWTTKKFSFEDILQVTVLQSGKIFIGTKSYKFSVDGFMENYVLFLEYLQDNVSPERITVVKIGTPTQ